jgi:hypothetical protein
VRRMAAFPSRLGTPAIPSADAAALARAARKGSWVRRALACALLVLIGVSVLLARRLEVRQGGFLPSGTRGVVVLDLSTSIEPAAFRRVVTVFEELAASDQRVGLVLFSDTAYEAVPPGTRGTALAPLVRYFTPTGVGRPGAALAPLVYPPNPWAGAFRGGTRISAGLTLAREVLERDGLERGSVLLVSDLDDSFFDLARLTETLVDYRRARIPLRIVPISPDPVDREYFRRLLGKRALVPWQELSARATSQSPAPLIAPWPVALLGVGLLVAALLALNEWWSGRLYVPRRGRTT